MRALLATVIVTCATFSTASAGTLNYSGALTADSPSYVREFRSFGDYRYSAFGFTTSETGSYQITTQAPTYDGYLFLYAGAFDPTKPSMNLIQFSDDGENFMSSSLIAQLTAGTEYFAVNTTYSVFSSNASAYPNAAGFSTTISGPGTIVAIDDAPENAVPEPETYTLLLAGLGLMGFVATRRKRM